MFLVRSHPMLSRRHQLSIDELEQQTKAPKGSRVDDALARTF